MPLDDIVLERRLQQTEECKGDENWEVGVSYSLKIKCWMVHRGSLWDSGGQIWAYLSPSAKEAVKKE